MTQRHCLLSSSRNARSRDFKEAQVSIRSLGMKDSKIGFDYDYAVCRQCTEQLNVPLTCTAW
jgi:hypothetical protein